MKSNQVPLYVDWIELLDADQIRMILNVDWMLLPPDGKLDLGWV
jgi:hypothetical protein